MFQLKILIALQYTITLICLCLGFKWVTGYKVPQRPLTVSEHSFKVDILINYVILMLLTLICTYN